MNFIKLGEVEKIDLLEFRVKEIENGIFKILPSQEKGNVHSLNYSTTGK